MAISSIALPSLIPLPTFKTSQDVDSEFFSPIKKFWQDLIETERRIDLNSYVELLQKVITDSIPIPPNFVIDHFLKFLISENQKDEKSKEDINFKIEHQNKLLELARAIDKEIGEVCIYEFLEYMINIQILLFTNNDYPTFHTILSNSNATPDVLTLCEDTLLLLENSLKNSIKLIEINFISPKIWQIQPDQVLNYFSEVNEKWSLLAGLILRLIFALMIWNASLNPGSNEYSINEPLDFEKMPAEFFQDLTQELNERNHQLIQFWEHVTTISQYDLSLEPYNNLKNQKFLKKISDFKTNLLKNLFPRRSLPKFSHDRTGLNNLFNCLDTGLSDNIDIEKYLEDNDLE